VRKLYTFLNYKAKVSQLEMLCLVGSSESAESAVGSPVFHHSRCLDISERKVGVTLLKIKVMLSYAYCYYLQIRSVQGSPLLDAELWKSYSSINFMYNLRVNKQQVRCIKLKPQLSRKSAIVTEHC